jgi:ABC-type transport system involved in multi-copper enzyme maturation permease subunit
MKALWVIASVTFREAARKKILWTALILGIGFLIVFGAGLHYQVGDLRAGNMPPFLRYQVLTATLMIGLYTVDLLAVVMAILTSVDTVSGEIASGTIQAIATKPIARWQVLMGKWLGFVAMLAVFVTLLFGGTLGVGYWIAKVALQNPVRGGLLVYLECLLVLTATFLMGTWFSTLTNGVIVLGLHGLAFLGGWLEQMSGFAQGSGLVTLGVASSVIMPTEAVWRRAAFLMQPPLAGALQFSPFANISVPSGAMVAYAGFYLLALLVAAIYHFQRRDL